LTEVMATPVTKDREYLPNGPLSGCFYSFFLPQTRSGAQESAIPHGQAGYGLGRQGAKRYWFFPERLSRTRGCSGGERPSTLREGRVSRIPPTGVLGPSGPFLNCNGPGMWRADFRVGLGGRVGDIGSHGMAREPLLDPYRPAGSLGHSDRA